MSKRLADVSCSFQEPLAYTRVHSEGTLNMLEAARESGALLVLASSQRVSRPSGQSLGEDVPPEPADPYGYSKLVAEEWVQMYGRLLGVRASVVRLFSVYGPGQRLVAGTSGVLAILARRALAGQQLVVQRGVQRDFTYIADAVRGMELVMGSPGAVGRTYNLATGVGTSLEELARLVKEATGSRSPVEVQEAPATEGSYVADVGRARRELGYSPQVDLRQGLSYYVEWLRQDTAQG